MMCSEAAQVDGRKWACVTGTVDDAGVCSATGKQLQSMELTNEQKTTLLAKVRLAIVMCDVRVGWRWRQLTCDGCCVGQIESLVQTDERRKAQWAEFKAWLDEHGPFDVVIDAANVGYFNQNFFGYVRLCPSCMSAASLTTFKLHVFLLRGGS